MHLLRGGDPATFLAPLAQWMVSDEAVAHTLPRTTISFLQSRVALVAFVVLSFLLSVFLAEPTVGQPRTNGVGAGALGFVGIICPPQRQNKRHPLLYECLLPIWLLTV